MPDKPLTIATYAAGASLAAITLVYVFGPTFLFDNDDASASTRKKGVVGLHNPANDCFINAVLQTLAGIPDLRIYLIREIHRRDLDGVETYRVHPELLHGTPSAPQAQKLEGLQHGIVTQALKRLLDNLNERPLYRKTISAQPFVGTLEQAFQTRISRQQQDAQEFLQVVTERLCDEYHAGCKARMLTRQRNTPTSGTRATQNEDTVQTNGAIDPGVSTIEGDKQGLGEDGYPFEGQMESQIECLTCGFKPEPSQSTFVTLTLSVPQKTSTTLNSCFDGMFKVEHIEDFKCDYCRIKHAITWKESALARCQDPMARMTVERDITKLNTCLKENPEKIPADVEMPENDLVPKRRIARHLRISKFPNVLAIHLSRSIFAASSSTKNMAKVAFPELLPLGGVLDQKQYRLLGLITHKGGHNSGHYETFRRQIIPVPFITPSSFGSEGVYSTVGSPNHSARQSPRLSAMTSPRVSRSKQELVSSPTIPPLTSPSASATSISSKSSQNSAPSSASSDLPLEASLSTSSKHSGDTHDTAIQSLPRGLSLPARSSSIISASVPSTMSASASLSSPPVPAMVTGSSLGMPRLQRKSKRNNRWWRISDDRIKESKLNDVLGMQKEVYLMFYELDR